MSSLAGHTPRESVVRREPCSLQLQQNNWLLVSGLCGHPSFFSDRYWTLQSCSSIQGHRNLKNGRDLKYILQNPKQSRSGTIWPTFRIQFPMQLTFDDHTESGFLWPICLQCCNDCDANSLDQFLQNSQQNGKWKSGGYFLFSISHLPNGQEIEKWKSWGSFLCSISQAHH